MIDALPDIASREFGSWIDPAALAATGALIGALIGGSWTPGTPPMGSLREARPAC